MENNYSNSNVPATAKVFIRYTEINASVAIPPNPEFHTYRNAENKTV